jgi:hypothetical protein
VKKFTFPIVMAVAGLLAVGVIAQNFVSQSPTTIKELTLTYEEGVTGTAYEPGDTIELPTGIDQVYLVVTTDDEKASVEIEGDSGFEVGNNTLTITVTGADNKSSTPYTLTLVKPELAGWCDENVDTIKLYNEDFELADIYQDISLAYLDERLPVIQENLSCFSDLLQAYVNENY